MSRKSRNDRQRAKAKARKGEWSPPMHMRFMKPNAREQFQIWQEVKADALADSESETR